MVTAALAAFLRTEGYDVGVMKPVHTGCRDPYSPRASARASDRPPPDTAVLMRAAQTRDPLDLVTPYRLRLPLSPLAAARADGRAIDPRRLRAAYRALTGRHEIMLVEGSGGLLVPVTAEATMADLMAGWDLVLLLVARAGLGTLNHTLLSIEAATRRGIRIGGVILNHARPVPGRRRDPSEAGNGALLRELTGLPVIGPLPYVAGLRRAPARAQQRWLTGSRGGRARPGARTSWHSLLHRCGIALPARR